MRVRWAAVAVTTAALVCGVSVWLQREEPPPDLSGTWRLRPDPPRPAGARPVPRPLGGELIIATGEMRWQAPSGPVVRPYTLVRVEGGALVLGIDLDEDGAPEELHLSWLPGEAGGSTFGLGQLSWSGWWTREPPP